MKKIVIDGHFVTEPINGIPRYATEIVKRLDSRFPKGCIDLIVPADAAEVPALKNVRVVRPEKSYRRKIVWSRLILRRYVNPKSACCVNFSNRTNMIKGSISMIHDLIPLRHDTLQMEFLNVVKRKLRYERWKARLLFCENIFWKKRKDEYIVTISEYSRQCIAKRFHIPEAKIIVIGNGWEHLKEIQETDERKNDKIRFKEYYFFIGNINPHKNIQWILQAAGQMPGEIFVIAGKVQENFARSGISVPDNVVWLGYISDSYMKYLMRGAKALLFPSLEEGFGIPPLEALALGTQVIASDIPVMRELYGDTIHYINPFEKPVNLNKILAGKLYGDTAKILETYSWERAAAKWEELLKKVMGEDVR